MTPASFILWNMCFQGQKDISASITFYPLLSNFFSFPPITKDCFDRLHNYSAWPPPSMVRSTSTEFSNLESFFIIACSGIFRYLFVFIQIFLKISRWFYVLSIIFLASICRIRFWQTQVLSVSLRKRWLILQKLLALFSMSNANFPFLNILFRFWKASSLFMAFYPQFISPKSI